MSGFLSNYEYISTFKTELCIVCAVFGVWGSVE